MSAPSQRDTINGIKTDLALVKQDLGYVKKEIGDQGKQLGIITDSIAKLAFVPLGQWEEYRHGMAEWQHSTERRLKTLEDYNEKNGLGIRFSNDIVNNIFKALAVAAAGALLIAAGWIAGKH